MKFVLTDNDMTFLRQYDKDEDVIPLITDIKKTDLGCEFSANFDDLIDGLTFAVISVGMDDEDTVNDIGKRLYSITDNLVAQKHSQSE